MLNKMNKRVGQFIDQYPHWAMIIITLANMFSVWVAKMVIVRSEVFVIVAFCFLALNLYTIYMIYQIAQINKQIEAANKRLAEFERNKK